MFEVGKKYKSKVGRYIYECLWSGKVIAILLESETGRECMEQHRYFNKYEEFVEPRKEYFNAYEQSSNGSTYYVGPFSTREAAEVRAERNRYGLLIVTHHSDTKVETEFHLTRKGK